MKKGKSNQGQNFKIKKKKKTEIDLHDIPCVHIRVNK